MSYPTLQLPPSGPDPPPPSDRRTILVVIAATSVLVLVLTGLGYLLTRDSGAETAAPGPVTTTNAPTATGEPSPASPTSSPTGEPSNPRTPTSSAPPVTPVFRYQPLWPFRSVSDAATWQRAAGEGHQPWRYDARMTAIAFAHDYLGYREIDRSGTVRTVGDEAWVGVGTELPDGTTSTAAVLHLARIGTGRLRPWEVVGSRDTTLSLTGPAYGARVSSPVTVSGVITGVDESLSVQIRSLDEPVLGSVTGVPAGGQNMPWAVPLTFRSSAADVATIAVSTGGHTNDVERFAVTGVRLRH